MGICYITMKDDNLNHNITDAIDFKFDETKLTLFSTTYFSSLPTYKIKKMYFDKFVFKIVFPRFYFIYRIWNEKQQSIYNQIYTLSALKGVFAHLTDKGDKFICRWLSDPNTKSYYKPEFKPYNGIYRHQSGNNDCYNTFGGYNPLILTEIDHAKIIEMIRPWLDIVLQLCEGEQLYMDYYLNWLSHMIKHPQIKLTVAILFRSKMGTGKGLHLKAIRNVIGKQHYISSEKTEHLFGRLGVNLSEKLLVNYDGDKTPKKFIAEIQNGSGFVMTGNANFVVDIMDDKRRVQAFQCTDKLLDKDKYTQFFKNASNLFKTPEFIASLYHFLNNRDIIHWNMMDLYKGTKAMKTLLNIHEPSEILFLEQYISDTDDKTKDIKIKGIELFTLFKKYTHNACIKNEINVKQFYLNLGGLKLDYLIKVTLHSAIVYKFNPEKLYDEMVTKKYIT